MKKVTTRGATVEEAIQSALLKLEISRDECDIHVIDEGKKGFLGIFGHKPAVVEVSTKDLIIEFGADYLREIIQKMDIDVEVIHEEKGRDVYYDLKSEDVALLIGKHGQTLNALEKLVGLAVNHKSKTSYFVTLDAMGYRERRKVNLQARAHEMADKVVREQKTFALEPMPASERKIIHKVLQHKAGITSYSEGKTPHRHIIIKPEAFNEEA